MREKRRSTVGHRATGGGKEDEKQGHELGTRYIPSQTHRTPGTRIMYLRRGKLPDPE